MMTPVAMAAALTIAISACLLGHNVRYDGGNKRQPWLTAPELAAVHWLPVCPEVEAGLGVPRPPIVLVRVPGADAPAVREAASDRDVTDAMREFARARIAALAQAGIAGYVLKSKSPSCGLTSAALYPPAGREQPEAYGAGLFAAQVQTLLPGLPMVEEHALAAAAGRAEFLVRACAYASRA